MCSSSSYFLVHSVAAIHRGEIVTFFKLLLVVPTFRNKSMMLISRSYHCCSYTLTVPIPMEVTVKRAVLRLALCTLRWYSVRTVFIRTAVAASGGPFLSSFAKLLFSVAVSLRIMPLRAYYFHAVLRRTIKYKLLLQIRFSKLHRYCTLLNSGRCWNKVLNY